MSMWLNRAGSKGEYESKFLDSKRIYLTFDNVDRDLREIRDKKEMYKWFEDKFEVRRGSAIQYSSQIRRFLFYMKIGDIVVLPSKRNSTIHFGTIKSDCQYDGSEKDIYKHYREVDWFSIDVPRSKFDQDLLYSFGAFSTICEIKRNDAESRIRKMVKNKWNKVTIISQNPEKDNNDSQNDENTIDLEQYSLDIIAKYIERRLKGYAMQDLIAAILKAKGYHTFVPSEGADEGVDILAGKGELGFRNPSICVQVKTTDSAVDRPTLDQLIGTMNNFGANYGILVSWNGFKNSVEKVRGKQYFKVRLWDQQKIIEELFDNYESMDEEIKSLIPLKRIWTLTMIRENE